METASRAEAHRTDPAVDDGDRFLRATATCFAIAVLLHNADHLRRGADSLRSDVFWGGTSSVFLEIGIVALIFLGHRLAPTAAVAVGAGLAAAFTLVHLLPGRPWLSDALFEGGASRWSQAAALLEIGAAAALAVAGRRALARRGGLATVGAGGGGPRTARTVSWTAALARPTVVLMTAGNLVLLVLTFTRR